MGKAADMVVMFKQGMKGGHPVKGLLVAFAIMVSLLSGLVSTLYVFKNLYLKT